MSTIQMPVELATGPALTARKSVAERSKSFGARSNYLNQVVLTSLPLMVADLVTLSLATTIATTVIGLCFGYVANVPMMLASLSAGLLFVNLFVGLYPGVGLHPIVEFRQTCLASTLLFGIVGIAAFVTQNAANHFLVLLASWATCLVLAPLGRSIARYVACGFDWWGQPVILFGDGPKALKICRSLQANRGLGLRPIGLVDDGETQNMIADAPNYLTRNQSSSEARRQCVFWAIVAVPDIPSEKVSRIIERLFRERYPHLIVVPSTTRLPSLWNHAHDCGGMPGFRLAEQLLLPLPRLGKRAMDLTIVLVVGSMILPVLALISLLIKISSPGAVFYSQERLGFGGHHFHAWKFRTMIADADQVLRKHLDAHPHLQEEWARDHKLKNDPRITRIGRWLRKTSLDELPQLWNVLLGQMSLVGPRPIVDAEIEKYGETFERYRKVVPGITGLWQISGRNNTTYQERVDLDSYYVRNWSPWLDLYILVRTIKVVLMREGAY